ncbi:fibronectin type III domain-containing protein [Micromonospora sonneratiae]|uniref:Fibronectin type III domain-containing protein n=1 Tax=Micromonospora sonneratiae TaxID=1184706 RepID=A0ABW3YHU7_9ACTN
MGDNHNSDESVGSGPTTTPRRRSRLRGGLVTIGTVGVLVVAMGLTVLGLGAADNAVASHDASAWLWSAAKSELARVNGITGRVDTRTQVPGARSHPMQVVQTDRMLLLRDLNTGQVSSLDLATLQIVATTKTTPGLGVNVALQGDAAFVVDAVQGVVRQLDPRSLTPIGEPVHYPPGITGGSFDGDGQLWIAVPSEGTVSAITAGPLPATNNGGGGGGGLSPKQVRTVAVAEPSHDLVVSTLDNGVAVLDRTTNTLTTVRGDEQRKVPLTLSGPGTLPARTTGPVVAVTVAEDRQVLLVGADGGVRQFKVPGEGTQLSPAVAWAGRIYCSDPTTGVIYSLDTATGQPADKIEVRNANGPLELEVRENHLFVNAPNSATAHVVDDKHQVRVVDKYTNDILGGDPPPPAPPAPPRKPTVGKPSAPRGVTAAAGDAQARVSWRPASANGAAITKYVVKGADRTFEVGANQRSLEVTGLVNGETYRFSVHAVNAKGAGPEATSNPVVPTSEVPDAPASVTAQPRPDGTVLVKWPAADGQGHKIAKYSVTAVSPGANAPAGESTRTELVVPAGELEYGTQYAFTVVAVSRTGAGSKSSPISNSVVPFNKPDAPTNLRATTVAGQPGAISVVWSPAKENGREITKYVVEANGRKIEVTDTRATVTGLGDGQNVTVKVQAVNEAGSGPAATDTARTVAQPQVTVTGVTVDATSATIRFTVDAGGGEPTCTVTPSGKSAVNAPNCSSLRVTGLTPSTKYTFTVTARNAAGNGTATGTGTTTDLWGTATCNNGASGDTATYCDRDRDGRNGNEIFSVTRQDNDKQVGWAKPGTRLKAYCKASGEHIDSYIYNDQKASTWWVRVEYKGRNYIPWAWLNLDGGDNISALPTC